tara:strand:+ start:1717 stop:1914 length:198 start_codon:yes stop_codon:yes gene_type:complete
MANIINFGKAYNITWFGNALETASSIQESTDLFRSQFTANERQSVEAIKCLADWIHTTALIDINN